MCCGSVLPAGLKIRHYEYGRFNQEYLDRIECFFERYAMSIWIDGSQFIFRPLVCHNNEPCSHKPFRSIKLLVAGFDPSNFLWQDDTPKHFREKSPMNHPGLNISHSNDDFIHTVRIVCAIRVVSSCLILVLVGWLRRITRSRWQWRIVGRIICRSVVVGHLTYRVWVG